jgi:ATP/maltotriose-dependent transcriptional regulator MalT
VTLRPIGGRDQKAPVLHGRDAETALLMDLLADAPSRSGVLVLRGEAGIGKTALLRHAIERSDGMRVLHVAGVESEAELPFAGLHQLIWPLLDEASTISEHQLAVLRGAVGAGPAVPCDRFQVSAALLSVLAVAAETRPLLCVVDDAHWLDTPSVDALAFVARRLTAEPIVFLFAHTDGEESPFRAEGLPQLAVEGIDRAAAERCLDDRFGSLLSPFVRDQLLAAAQGNPLALLELPKALTADQLAGRDRLFDPLPVTWVVERAFMRRVGKLGPEAQQLLLVAAADDTHNAAVVCAAAARLGVDGRGFSEAETAGLIVASEGTLDFRHPLVRGAVYHAAGLEDRRAAHRALADVLDADRYRDRRAWHRAAATLDADPDVAGELAGAAEAAKRRGGYGAAATALERAAALTPSDAERAERFAAAADAAWLAGQTARAVALAGEAYGLAESAELRVFIGWLRARIELHEGNPAYAFEIFFALAEALAGLSSARAADLVLEAAGAAFVAGDEEVNARIAALAKTLRVGAGGHKEELAILSGIAAMGSGEVSRGAKELRHAVAASVDTTQPRRLAWAGSAALEIGDDTSARRLFGRLVGMLRDAGAVGLLPEALQRLALAEIADGRFASAGANASEGLRLANDTGQVNCASHHRAILAWVAAVGGDEDVCRQHAREVFRVASAHGLGRQMALATAALGELELGLGRPDDALAHLESLVSQHSQSRSFLIERLVAPSVVEAAMRAGREELARGVVDRYAAWVETVGSASQRALLERCRALLAEGEDALRRYDEATRLHAESGRLFDAARTRLLCGEALRRSRRRREARTHLYAALDTFEKIGAESWATRARNELRGSGMTAQRGDPSLLDQLTPQELQVAKLVAAGSSNKEVAAQLFLSPRTIDFHLRNIFAKLGITSRIQLSWFHLAEEGPVTQLAPAPGSFTGATVRKAA